MTPAAGVWRFDFQPTETAAPPRCSIRAEDLPASIPDFRSIPGDWSFAGWDPRVRAVTLATDYVGVRPIYYQVTAGGAFWSASLAELIRATGAAELDEQYVASFLSLRTPAGRTPYRNIRVVPPGHIVRLREGRASVERYWDLPDRETCYSDPRDYEERLLELFREAIETRVAGHERICAELSGGLDSSSVVCMAAELHPGLTTISYTHPGAADAPFIWEVEARCGAGSVHLEIDQCPFASPEYTGGAAPGWWEARYRALARHLASIGATALLTGQLGDLMMGNALDDSDQVAGFLRRRQFRDAGVEAYRWSRWLRIPIYPILWRALRMTVSAWTPGPSDDLTPTAGRARVTDASLAPPLQRLADESAVNPYEYTWKAAPPERRRRCRAAAGMLSSHRLQVPEALRHVGYAHPFAHRPLVEFMLTIPPGVVCRPGEPRRLQRRAFRNLLPEAVLQRRSKASFGDAFLAALRPMASEMSRRPDALQVVERGYVDRASLLKRLEQYAGGLDCNASQLQAVILLEYWLRAL